MANKRLLLTTYDTWDDPPSLRFSSSGQAGHPSPPVPSDPPVDTWHVPGHMGWALGEGGRRFGYLYKKFWMGKVVLLEGKGET